PATEDGAADGAVSPEDGTPATAPVGDHAEEQPLRGPAPGGGRASASEAAEAAAEQLTRRRREEAPQKDAGGDQPRAESARGRSEESDKPARRISFHNEKVLIVDDDVRNVFALTSVLERHGLLVLYAENGREGIEVLESNEDIALVLMDIMMPEMDGYATTSAIRRMPQFSGLPIVALTAKAMKGDREKSIESGASDHVTKPVDTDYLLEVMDRWMNPQ
ncbi:response regulator, partial [Streptomyces spiramenti]|uniref:response regulator n=1 Tax=Streptomyces spiramenti TaxID=2720606 RepID=UPI001FD83F6F